MLSPDYDYLQRSLSELSQASSHLPSGQLETRSLEIFEYWIYQHMNHKDRALAQWLCDQNKFCQLYLPVLCD
ncbi:MAG: hypothetical protein RRB13_13155 [bacterium]|nr:hypothetical protein [bacterium]